MSISYVNGRYLPKKNAKISIEDRGFNFSDGVYELIKFSNLFLLNFEDHTQRLENSLSSIEIVFPFSNKISLKIIINNLIKLNNFESGYVYVQVTRGTAKRDHKFPLNVKSNVIISIFPEKDYKDLLKGIKVKIFPDLRWSRCDIKSISLLPNVLGKEKAHKLGVYEIWQKNINSEITEGTTSNSFIVNHNDEIQTHPKNNNILGGVTRNLVIALAKKNDLKVKEKPFNVKEAYNCKEAFLTSTTVGILPVLSIDEMRISSGKPGEITKLLIAIFQKYQRKQSIKNG
tara:strand:- start:564 stop:1424 length:861 start_codon:yes stop_codon:yes gene_type:complete